MTAARLGRLAGRLALLAGFGATTHAASAQPVPFRIVAQEAARQPAPGLHSFSFAQRAGRWLLVGGRTNGFHRTSDAESTFPSQYANEYLYVVDPTTDFVWKAGIPEPYRQILRTSNAASYQDGDVLYVVGGYGSSCDDDKPSCYRTYPNLTALRVSSLMDAITTGRPDRIPASIVTLSDPRMQVTGGALKKLGDYFYLVFGQDYDSIYKGAYTGKYTEEIRRFKLQLSGSQLAITDYSVLTAPGSGSESPFHRRDLNVVAAVRPDGGLGLTAYGGVFTRRGGAWLNPVYINHDGSGKATAQVDETFSQKLGVYDCAHILLYDPGRGRMYTTLLGGIGFYYYNKEGQLEESNLDNWMPFSGAITTIVRGPDGNTVEVPQPAAHSLPKLLGANAVFVPAPALARYAGSDILDYSRLPPGNRVLLGHLYGGIWATAGQSSEFNPTFASKTIYEVYLEPSP